MTATNHMLTGAVIAVAVQKPLLVIPLALVSHFILDTFPHFGVEEDDDAARNNHPLFRLVLRTDLLILFTALLTIPFLFDNEVSWWVIVAGMLAAWLPDVVWLLHYWQDYKGRDRKPPIRLTRFHKKIQWFERPHGLITEVLWLGGALTMLVLIAS